MSLLHLLRISSVGRCTWWVRWVGIAFIGKVTKLLAFEAPHARPVERLPPLLSIAIEAAHLEAIGRARASHATHASLCIELLQHLLLQHCFAKRGGLVVRDVVE